MPIDRRRALALGGALAAPALLRSPPAAAQETTLRLHHFLPAVSNVHRFFLQPWAQKVQSESGGRLRIQIFPAMQLGGAPPQLYDQADRKSTRLNSSHANISYAVFCLKKKKKD